MKRTPLAIIFSIVFIDLLGFGIVIPILPSYAQRGFGAGDLTVGLIIASFSAMQFIFTPLFGKISDRRGRRPLLILGLCFSAAGYILFGLVNSLLLLFVSRLLAGIGGANISAAQAYIADVTPPEERAKGMGLVGAAFGLGFLFGPLIGGLLAPYGYHVPGFVAAGLSTAALCLTIFFLPEPPADRKHAAQIRKIFLSADDFRSIARRPEIGRLIGLYFFIIFATANTYATFPIYGAKDFGMSDREIGYIFGIIGFFGALMQGGVIRHAVKYMNEKRVFLIGSIVTALGFLFLGLAPSVPLVYAAATIYSVGANTVMPVGLSLISQRTNPREQGSILGINQSLSSLARVLGPINGGFLFEHLGHRWPFYAGGIVMAVVSTLTMVHHAQSAAGRVPSPAPWE